MPKICCPNGQQWATENSVKLRKRPSQNLTEELHCDQFEIGGDNVNELEQLYNNAASYAEDFGFNISPEWKDLSEKIAGLTEEISSLLDDKQREKLKLLIDLYTRQVCLETDRMFFYAFTSGARLIMDIQNK